MDTMITYPLFGSEINIIFHETAEFVVQEFLEDIVDESNRLQKIFNFYDDESELSILNKKRRLGVSDELLHVFLNAKKYHAQWGSYNVGLGKTTLFMRTNKASSPLDTSLNADFKIKGHKIFLSENGLIDLGSIAKGYITDKIGEFLTSLGFDKFTIDSRGDILTSVQTDIDLSNPKNPEEVILTLRVRKKAIATSGDYNQRYNGKSHIVGENKFSSATVIASTLEEADAMATMVMLGAKIKKPYMTISHDSKIKFYNDFEKFIKEKQKIKLLVEMGQNR